MDRVVMHRMVSICGLISIALLLSLVTQSALASDRSKRCGVHVIYAGGSKGSARMFEVLKKCGEPVMKQGCLPSRAAWGHC